MIAEPSNELKEIIINNPDLPILTLVSNDATNPDYSYTLASVKRSEIGEVLDIPRGLPLEPPTNDKIYTSRGDLECDLRDIAADEEEYCCMSEEEFDSYIESRMNDYEEYWQPCIMLIVDSY